MSRKKAEPPEVPHPPAPKATSQARMELPAADFERVRAASRSIGLSLTAFIRMAVLRETRRIEEGRD
jgi:hypothetical protein